MSSALVRAPFPRYCCATVSLAVLTTRAVLQALLRALLRALPEPVRGHGEPTPTLAPLTPQQAPHTAAVHIHTLRCLLHLSVAARRS